MNLESTPSRCVCPKAAFAALANGLSLLRANIIPVDIAPGVISVLLHLLIATTILAFDPHCDTTRFVTKANDENIAGVIRQLYGCISHFIMMPRLYSPPRAGKPSPSMHYETEQTNTAFDCVNGLNDPRMIDLNRFAEHVTCTPTPKPHK